MTKKKSIKPTHVSAAHLHEFKYLHSALAHATERQAHVRTIAQLAQATHEANVMRHAQEHSARMRLAKQQQDEAQSDVDAAERAAKIFAGNLGSTYDVDLKTHAVDPVTGAIVRLPEGTHG